MSPKTWGLGAREQFLRVKGPQHCGPDLGTPVLEERLGKTEPFLAHALDLENFPRQGVDLARGLPCRKPASR